MMVDRGLAQVPKNQSSQSRLSSNSRNQLFDPSSETAYSPDSTSSAQSPSLPYPSAASPCFNEGSPEHAYADPTYYANNLTLQQPNHGSDLDQYQPRRKSFGFETIGSKNQNLPVVVPNRVASPCASVYSRPSLNVETSENMSGESNHVPAMGSAHYSLPIETTLNRYAEKFGEEKEIEQEDGDEEEEQDVASLLFGILDEPRKKKNTPRKKTSASKDFGRPAEYSAGRTGRTVKQWGVAGGSQAIATTVPKSADYMNSQSLSESLATNQEIWKQRAAARRARGEGGASPYASLGGEGGQSSVSSATASGNFAPAPAGMAQPFMALPPSLASTFSPGPRGAPLPSISEPAADWEGDVTNQGGEAVATAIPYESTEAASATAPFSLSLTSSGTSSSPPFPSTLAPAGVVTPSHTDRLSLTPGLVDSDLLAAKEVEAMTSYASYGARDFEKGRAKEREGDWKEGAMSSPWLQQWLGSPSTGLKTTKQGAVQKTETGTAPASGNLLPFQHMVNFMAVQKTESELEKRNKPVAAVLPWNLRKREEVTGAAQVFPVSEDSNSTSAITDSTPAMAALPSKPSFPLPFSVTTATEKSKPVSAFPLPFSTTSKAEPAKPVLAFPLPFSFTSATEPPTSVAAPPMPFPTLSTNEAPTPTTVQKIESELKTDKLPVAPVLPWNLKKREDTQSIAVQVVRVSSAINDSLPVVVEPSSLSPIRSPARENVASKLSFPLPYPTTSSPNNGRAAMVSPLPFPATALAGESKHALVSPLPFPPTAVAGECKPVPESPVLSPATSASDTTIPLSPLPFPATVAFDEAVQKKKTSEVLTATVLPWNLKKGDEIEAVVEASTHSDAEVSDAKLVSVSQGDSAATAVATKSINLSSLPFPATPTFNEAVQKMKTSEAPTAAVLPWRLKKRDETVAVAQDSSDVKLASAVYNEQSSILSVQSPATAVEAKGINISPLPFPATSTVAVAVQKKESSEVPTAAVLPWNLKKREETEAVAKTVAQEPSDAIAEVSASSPDRSNQLPVSPARISPATAVAAQRVPTSPLPFPVTAAFEKPKEAKRSPLPFPSTSAFNKPTEETKSSTSSLIAAETRKALTASPLRVPATSSTSVPSTPSAVEKAKSPNVSPLPYAATSSFRKETNTKRSPLSYAATSSCGKGKSARLTPLPYAATSSFQIEKRSKSSPLPYAATSLVAKSPKTSPLPYAATSTFQKEKSSKPSPLPYVAVERAKGPKLSPLPYAASSFEKEKSTKPCPLPYAATSSFLMPREANTFLPISASSASIGKPPSDAGPVQNAETIEDFLVSNHVSHFLCRIPEEILNAYYLNEEEELEEEMEEESEEGRLKDSGGEGQEENGEREEGKTFVEETEEKEVDKAQEKIEETRALKIEETAVSLAYVRDEEREEREDFGEFDQGEVKMEKREDVEANETNNERVEALEEEAREEKGAMESEGSGEQTREVKEELRVEVRDEGETYDVRDEAEGRRAETNSHQEINPPPIGAPVVSPSEIAVQKQGGVIVPVDLVGPSTLKVMQLETVSLKISAGSPVRVQQYDSSIPVSSCMPEGLTGGDKLDTVGVSSPVVLEGPSTKVLAGDKVETGVSPAAVIVGSPGGRAREKNALVEKRAKPLLLERLGVLFGCFRGAATQSDTDHSTTQFA